MANLLKSKDAKLEGLTGNPCQPVACENELLNM